MNSASKNKFSFTILKVPSKYAAFVMPFFLSILMTCVVSLISTLRSVGFIDNFPYVWLNAWCISWIVAFPTLLLLLPIVKKLTLFVVKTS